MYNVACRKVFAMLPTCSTVDVVVVVLVVVVVVFAGCKWHVLCCKPPTLAIVSQREWRGMESCKVLRFSSGKMKMKIKMRCAKSC